MSKDLEEQLNDKVRDNCFATQVDEATDTKTVY